MSGLWQKKAWLTKGAEFGAYVQRHGPSYAEVLCRAGFDFLMFDCEHGPRG